MLGFSEVFYVDYKLIAVTKFADGTVTADVQDEGTLTVVADDERDACEWVEDVILCEVDEEVTEEYTTTFRVETYVVGSFEVYDQYEAERYHLARA